MLNIAYTPSFVRRFKSLEVELQEEVLEKIEIFKDITNHKQLKVHKLKGSLSGRFSFSVNYKTRIVFTRLAKNKVVFLTIGDHGVYK